MEPECLRRGKEFHKKVQSDWDMNIKDGNLNIEHTINLLSYPSRAKHIKNGRLDLFVDELGEFVSVIEIKSTDWDKIKPSNIHKLLTSHRRQIWNYISEYLDNDKIEVCPGIIYPVAPSSNEHREYIEEYLNSYGIQVVWYYDEQKNSICNLT
jgi:hypothetical protein